ncbi:MAG TPA: Ig-like domain-containing protein [Longimicrobium sp.]|jgi:uncharacterized protein YjdB
MRMTLRRLPLAAGLLVAALSCGDSPTGSGTPGPSGGPTGTREGEKLVLASGGTQLGVIGTRLSSPVVVRVLDARDQPVPDAAIDFVVTTGGGSVSPGQVRTDREGRAQALWTLGAAPGEQKLSVTGAGGSVVVAATAASSATATVLQKLSGDGFTAPPRSDLPLSVRAVDGSGNPVAGLAVSWAVEGGGSFSSASALTGADGSATARWTLGDAAAQRATVTVPGAPAAVFGATLALSPAAVARVAVQPDSLALKAGATGRLSAVAYDAAGNVLTGRIVAWSSADAAVATAGADGTITGVAPGTTRATATVEGIAASAQVRVLPAEAVVARVVVQPDSLVLAPGATGDLNAVAYDAQGNVLTGRAVVWTSSNAAVATLGTGGTVTGVAEGTAEVTAKVDGISAVAKVRVRAVAPPPPVPVAAVRVEPDTLTLQIGASGQLKVIALDAAGNVLTGRAATLVSSSTAIITLGTDGQVTGVAVGSATVTATVEGVSGRATVKVQAAPPPPPAAVASVSIVPDTLTLQIGASAQLRVIARDAAGNELTGRAVTLVSSSTAIITLGSDGRVTGAGEGSATVTATVEGVTGRATIKVVAAPPAAVASVRVQPDSLTLTAGATATLTAAAYDAQGNLLTGRVVTWTSSNGAVVGFESGGTVRGIAAGTARVTATVEGVSASITVTVLAPRAVVTRVVVQPDSLVLAPGATGDLNVAAYDSAGNVVTGRAIVWASSSTGVATVGAGGAVTAVAAGTAQVSATVEGVTGSAKVIVRAGTYRAVASIRVWPDSLILDQGESRLISASTYDSNGNVSGRPVTYTSSNTAVAKLDANWKVVGVAPGTARIIASSEGVEAYIGVRVVAVPTGSPGGYTIEKISGDGQTAEFGQELPLQLMVRVLRAGYPVANAQVTWTADSGGGFIYTYPNTGLTDSNGRATIKWYMGPKEGRQLATASVEGGGSVQFEATGVRAAYGGEVNSIQFNPGMTWLEPGMSSSLYGVALKDSKAARWAVLSWTIDNPDVLSVRIEPTGVSWSRVYFTALKPGEATFTATSGNLTKSITIKVFPPGSLGGGGGGGGSAIRAQP